ncbi:dimethylarginine dimethylaminohydrolase family protein [Streptomyces sp. BP-8]|uniref:Arginine deiminase family protein n=1 Tax=Streptomyces sirii TaxID=3127701 RepID=A0ABZ2QDU8_9ACTN
MPDSELAERLLFRERPDAARLALQPRAFVKAIEGAGVSCRYVAELVGDTPAFAAACADPNLMFTRDAAVTLPWAPDVYLPGRMAEPMRRPETAVLSTALESLGLTRIEWDGPEHAYLEGGDVVPFTRSGSRCLLIGFARRTTFAAVECLRHALLPGLVDEIFAVELAPWRMNLDGGLVPLADDVVVAHTPSVVSCTHLTVTGQHRVDLFGVLRELGITVVEVPQDASWLQQACNYLCLGDRTVIGYDMCPSVLSDLRETAINVIDIAGDELVKGRGGPRCMSRPIYAPAAVTAADLSGA